MTYQNLEALRGVRMSSKEPKVALVTGASRGVGKGVATALANAGYVVYATGRTIKDAELPRAVHALPCDQTDDTEVSADKKVKAVPAEEPPIR